MPLRISSSSSRLCSSRSCSLGKRSLKPGRGREGRDQDGAARPLKVVLTIYAEGVSSPTLLYDQNCGFCRWSVNRFLAWDPTGELRAVPLQSEEAGRLLSDMEPSVRMGSAHLVFADGQVYSAGAITDPLLRMLRGGRLFAALARTLPGTTERVYRLVAHNRHRLGRLLGAAACAVEPESI